MQCVVWEANMKVQKYTANVEELAQRVLLSQERLRDAKFGEKNVRVVKVWAACIALTAGWGKTGDTVHVSAVEKQAGLPPGKASSVLRDLHDAGVIQWSKHRGHRQMGVLTLPALGSPQDDDTRECTACGAVGYIVNGVCGSCGADQ
jgi:hypothetical protein